MIFKILSTKTGYIETMCRCLELNDAEPGSEEFEEREILLVLIKDYEFRQLNASVHE
jgi:hypothetical protein